MKRLIPAFVLLVLLAAGCGTSYSWRSSVPREMRTVFVPTFRNESPVMEAGALASRQLLREIQREGTFRISNEDDAAIEIQGKITGAASGSGAYDRRSRLRMIAYDMTVKATVSVVDKLRGRVLIDNRQYVGMTTFTAGQDISNAERDATGRAVDDIAQKVVDDLLKLDFKKGEGK